MPILMWVFSASFLLGAARIILAGLGFGFLIGTSYMPMIHHLHDLIFQRTGGDAGIIGYFLSTSGVYRCFEYFISAYMFRLAIQMGRQLRVIR